MEGQARPMAWRWAAASGCTRPGGRRPGARRRDGPHSSDGIDQVSALPSDDSSSGEVTRRKTGDNPRDGADSDDVRDIGVR